VDFPVQIPFKVSRLRMHLPSCLKIDSILKGD